MRKSCVVVIGAGDGSQTRALEARYARILTVVLPGEQPIEGLPGYQFVVQGGGAAGDIVSRAFSRHEYIVRLPDTDFYDRHPIAVDEAVRQSFMTEFYDLLARQPFLLGDDIIDGLQGAWHIAKSAGYILPSPMVKDLPRLTVPAIAIGAGPSLAKYLPILRELQNKCILVCCDSALNGVLAAGITPHFVTPLERVQAIVKESFGADRYPGVIFAGTPVVHQDIAPKFDRHLYLPGTDLLFAWAMAERDDMLWYGQSTGVVATAIAGQLTSGPVYLVGHDLAYDGDASHWEGVSADVAAATEEKRFPVPGNSGQPVMTRYWWDAFRREIEGMAKDRGGIINVNATEGVGALINHTLPGSLPDPASLEPFSLPEWPAPNLERLNAFYGRLLSLPVDARGMLSKLASSRLTAADLNIRTLCPSDNHLFFSYILRSVLGQFSMENHSGKPPDAVVEGMAEALRTSIRALLPMLEEMAACVPVEVACA